MTSFVAEVLSSAGQMEREEINEKLSLLGRRMEELKLEIHSATSESTSTMDFESVFETTATLSEKVKAISDEMEQLTDKIESEVKGQLNISTFEFQSLSRQLEQVTMVMDVLEKLTKAQQQMENISTATSEGKYSEASAALAVLEEAFRQPVCEQEEQVKILVSVRIQYEVLKQKLIQDLGDCWKDTVSWTCLTDPSPSSAKSDQNGTSTSTTTNSKEDVKQWQLKITLPKSDSDSEQENLLEMVTALESLGQLERKLQIFSRQLSQYVFFGLALCYQKMVVTETALTKGKQVALRGAGEKTYPGVVEMFSFVGGLLDLLNDSLLHVEVERRMSAGDEQGGGGGRVTLMNLVGEEIGEKVLDGIVKDCLSHAIPSTNKELESFHEVIAATQMFHDKLVTLGFISDSCRTLLEYVQNVNVLFAKKKCQDILEQARKLMTTDIHDTVQISSDASPGELAPLDKGGNPSKEKLRKIDIASDPLLSNKTFCMPTCRISACIKELLDLAYFTLNEAATSSPQCAVQMFYAVRNIFELFCSVFPTYHAHSLANFPQLTALHHNNCMFLAHHLMTLGHQFKASLPSDVSGTFVDLVQEVRRLGTTSFVDQMNTQKGILEQYLEAANGFVEVDEENNYGAAERAIKQCHHQLTHLQKVWQDVLPTSVYRKAIGVLFNTVVTHMIDSITALEDISSDAGRKLFALLKMVDEKGASLFVSDTDSAEVKAKVKAELLRYVAKYGKFTELQLVLNGSLQEIADRWAEGMGPLASEFPSTEVKQLIRALFQNTDRRAAVLAKIK